MYEEVANVHSRIQLFTNISYEIYKGIKSKSNLNPFNNYLEFLKEQAKLNEEEEKLINTRAFDFINMIETTSMSKTYKMPILLAFYNNGDFKISISDDDIYKRFKEFYEKGSNGSDMLKHNSTKDYKTWNKVSM